MIELAAETERGENTGAGAEAGTETGTGTGRGGGQSSLHTSKFLFINFHFARQVSIS